MKYGYWVLLGFISFTSPVWAYSDRVDAPAGEIYQAAQGCFADMGIYKESAEDLAFTTKWKHETIRRVRKRKFIPVRLKETVDIRYQMKFKFEQDTNYTNVSIRGRFEERRTDGHPMQPWKPSSSSKELYFRERKDFFKLLACVEDYKNKSKTPSSEIPTT